MAVFSYNKYMLVQQNSHTSGQYNLNVIGWNSMYWLDGKTAII